MPVTQKTFVAVSTAIVAAGSFALQISSVAAQGMPHVTGTLNPANPANPALRQPGQPGQPGFPLGMNAAAPGVAGATVPTAAGAAPQVNPQASPQPSAQRTGQSSGGSPLRFPGRN